MTTSAFDTNRTAQTLDMNSKRVRQSNMVAPVSNAVSPSIAETMDGTNNDSFANCTK
jgi:hypothetical protein